MGETGRYAAAVAIGVLVVLNSMLIAGAVGDSPMEPDRDDMMTEFVASPVEVCPETVAQTPYQRESGSRYNVTRNFEALDMPHEVVVSNYVTEYSHEVERSDGTAETVSTSVVISTPKVERLGQPVNPIARWSPKKLAREFGTRLDGYGTLENFTRRGTYSITISAQETTATSFETMSQTNANESARVAVDVALASYQDDLIIMATATRSPNADVQTPVDTSETCLHQQ
ncbi:DUF6517 family protein [Haloarcula amylovorans]|uniref:DUF6517 family protein n=1 Tax=Haloarcula amylovorans TaxID=2562280 RepID=UPI0010769CF5|nr:DUF6517 family protein [Halomicroarcula amylolytica]